jgi:hypothetical protein
VIASHYAEPVQRKLARPTPLLGAPECQAEQLCELGAGEPFLMLDDSIGWAWGYAGKDKRVGYVPSEALTR